LFGRVEERSFFVVNYNSWKRSLEIKIMQITLVRLPKKEILSAIQQVEGNQDDR